jgi:hypothetical protein
MTGNIFLNSQNIRTNTIPKREIISSDSVPTSGENSDDFYKVTQVSYDSDLLAKGITSSAPVTLAVVPFKKLTASENAEAEILNIQRNLNTITISNVNDIINDLTGSGFSSNELEAINDSTQYAQFKSAVSSITAAYNAKAAYMTHLANMYMIETDENFSYDYGEGTFPQKLNAIGITESESKLGWLERQIKITKSGYNIAQLMQIIRNSFARRKFGKNFVVGTPSSSPLAIETASLSYYDELYETFFGPVYADRDSSISDYENKLDTLIIADSKDITYTANQIDPAALYSRMIGSLANFNQQVNLTSSANVGIFSNLLTYVDESYTVLPVDVNVGDQDALKLYRSADEFFLGMPLITDKTLLKTRSQRFANDATAIENSFKADVKTLAGLSTSTPRETEAIKDLGGWKSFLAQMSIMMEESFYTTQNWTSTIRFAILLKAAEDAQVRNKIFKIMMLRERVRNYKSYVVPGLQNDFLTAAKNELEDAIADLVTLFTPSESSITGAQNDDEIDQLEFDSFKSALGQSTVFDVGSASQFEWDTQKPASSLIYEVIEGLTDPADHQWDNFFKSAILAENITSTSSRSFKTISNWQKENSVLQAKVGISTGFLGLSRDDRALLFLSKWLSIIVDFPFYIEVTEGTMPSHPVDTGKNDYGVASTFVAVMFKAYYSTTAYAELKKALSLTYTDTTDAASFENFLKYTWPISQNILQDGQDFYDGVNFVYRFIMQASSLLTIASDLAFNYTPTFGESLSNNYTYNAVLNLNRQSRFAFSKNDTYDNFSKDQHKTTDTLNGFLRYVQDDPEVSTAEDSFLVICGLPYGILDRLGAFDQTKIGYLNVTLTLKTINSIETDDVVITKKYPIQGYVEHQLLNYTPTINASRDQVLSATSLYELNKNRTFVTNLQFTPDSKINELQSTSLLNYVQMFYGFIFGPYITVQKELPDITSQGVLSARSTIQDRVYEYRLAELIETRYASTGTGALIVNKSNLITQALGGNIFDKIIAIPVDANLLTRGRNGYLADVIASVTTEFSTREAVTSTRSVTQDPQALIRSPNLSRQSISNVVNNTVRINR